MSVVAVPDIEHPDIGPDLNTDIGYAVYVPCRAVADRLRRAYPALPERAGVGSITANSDALNVPSFHRWRFEMKLSPPCSVRYQ
jgi:hypothetical protein